MQTTNGDEVLTRLSSRSTQQWPDGLDTPLWQPFLPFTIAPSASSTQTAAPQIPEGWLVAIHPGAGIRVGVVAGTGVGGAVAQLGGGGSCKIPSNGDAISFQNYGANPATITLVAMRGKFLDWVSITPGDLS